jgi:hypothetical protein
MLRARSLRSAVSITSVALAFALAPAPVQAGGTRTFRLEDHAELDAGETEGAAIEASGRVTTGFLPKRATVPGNSAFSCLGRENDIVIGTADAATLQRVTFPAGGKAKAKGKGKTGEPQVDAIATLPGVVVTAIAPLPGGDLVAATLPGGVLHRVDSKGKVTELAKLDVEQIWALLVHDGKLWVGTGPKGEVYSMSLSGKDPKVVLDVEEKHVLTLLAVGKQIVAGTSQSAKLYQIAKDPGGVLLHEFSGDEVRALALTRTGLLAAVNEFEDRKLSSLDALVKTLSRTSLMGVAPSGDLGEARPPKSTAAVHHVDLGKGRDLARASEATWETWLSREDQYFTSLLALDDVGTVLVASSAGGKVYRMRGPRDTSTIADLEEKQATSLCRTSKGPILATAGQGAAAYRLLSTTAATARWRSKVLDAKQPAAFGALVLRGKGPVTARARVGPTKDPDDARWTKWKAIKLAKGPGELRGTLAGVDKRRYVQVEVNLDSPDSELRELALFYAPENLAPLVQAIDVDRPTFDEATGDEPSADVTIKWTVDARDEDELAYDVRVRPEGGGEDTWVRLSDDDEVLTKKELKWDLTTVPDGIYEIEIKASDAPSNGDQGAAEDGLVSAPFVVDRQRPALRDVRAAGRKVTATAADSGSYVHDVAFAVDGGSFRTVSADDGLFDQPEEAITLELPKDLSKGKHRLVLRARDAHGNIGAFALFVEI